MDYSKNSKFFQPFSWLNWKEKPQKQGIPPCFSSHRHYATEGRKFAFLNFETHDEAVKVRGARYSATAFGPFFRSYQTGAF